MRYKAGNPCPVCHAGKLFNKVVEEKFSYKGEILLLPNYMVFECGKCGEEFVDDKTIRGTEKVLTDFRRTVDGLLTSDNIRAIREKLDVTQEKLADILGVAKKTFARYENGQVTQSKTMDTILRLLAKKPELIEDIAEILPYASMPEQATMTTKISTTDYNPMELRNISTHYDLLKEMVLENSQDKELLYAA